jgi:dihydroorotase-like cyclic amidohydrolase
MKEINMSIQFHLRTMDLPDQLLEGAIDMHVHCGPHLVSSPRRVDPFQAAEQALAAGMRAIVMMDVIEPSTGTAWLVRRKVEGIQIFGGLVLNSNCGGMNPRAVTTALNYGAGAKFISFGAHCTYHIASSEGRMIDGKPALFMDFDQDFIREEVPHLIRIPLEDPVPPALDKILRLLAEHPDVYLNTGHVSGDEGLRLVQLAKRYGIQRVLVAHVSRDHMTLEQRLEAVRLGAFLEATFADCVYPSGPQRFNYYAEEKYLNELPSPAGKMPGGLKGLRDEICQVGFEHYILGTDYGINAAPPPVEAMRQFITSLLELNFSVDEIRRMTAENPARLLGLE